MKLFTFIASSPALALQKAQQACGRDAIVVSTKQIHKKTLTKEALYELVVAVEDNTIIKQEPKKAEIKPIFDNDILSNIKKTVNQLSSIEKMTDPIPDHTKDINSSKIKAEIKDNEFKDLHKQIGSLSDKINILQNMLWNENSHAKELSLPPEFAEIYNLAKNSGMKGSHLDSIMNETLKQMPFHMKSRPQIVKRYFKTLLKKMIPTKAESDIKNGEKRVIMFVGPTGVGKTTTLAKIAAKYSFLKYKNRVGIISLDTYRIGALEQLYQYAKMLKLPMEDAIDSIDFERALDTLGTCDLVLIDTAGSSQHDKEKIMKIADFIKNTNHKIDINLVLSASSKLGDLEDALLNFSFLDIDSLIFTKLDETTNFGNIFSLLYENAKQVSYFSTGQEVPDDLEVASGELLVESIFEGLKKKALRA